LDSYYSEVGIGTKKDPDEAKRWYMRAASQGNKRAMQRLTELKSQGDKKGKKGGKELARPSRQQAKEECVIS
jgi:TPR repeat protein